ncbi:CHAT domain-containing protein [Okeania sp. SIO2B3]|uniref:CHAT domain-containing protein n=1 Tax=Okeania sp. SIO2B3 TaxID=2607784 RepID=UPI0013C189E9|nr:CHAT domain-containing protein [Okeania sp. SIO2B3]NET40421.1 CHAT domain-containing protein [Okeania sp. SIO2B3]
MKLITLHLCPLISFVSLLGTVALPAHSQPITPANDGTGTTVNQNGNQFNIQGGTHNGTNLFHSFGKFNLNSGQTANFISTPDTRNILGRITGGDPSIINGLIQVIGGNSNLFLMNPAGVMFGPNASLNIPASFSVTTATGIGFNSNNFWFQAMGTNDYSNLVGNPSGYNFNVSNPGVIVNEGNLSLNPGQDLTLAGGTVINTGELSTVGGNITIAAVNGGDTLRISQPGHLLSLDVSPTSNNLSGQSITPTSLPELLTGGDIHHASSVVMNAQGNLELTDTAGVAIASGNINVSDTSNGSIGGQVNVLGDRVAVIDANISANGLNGGGKILIGGDFQGNGIVPNSQQTFVNNNSTISADAINNGDGGQVIIWSDKTTNFAGNISAKGGNFSGDGGFVEISGKEQLIFDGNVNVAAAFGETGTILFDPKNINIGESESSNEPPEQNEDDNVTFSVEEIEELEGEIILQADNDITVNEPIETSDAIELKAGRNININADIDTSQSNSNISLFGNDNSANINNRDQGAGSINQREGTTLNSGSGDITIRLGNLGTNGDINLANLTTTGQLFINADQGNIRQVSPNSLITANRAIFETQNSGGVGLAETPLRIDVNNLEVLTGEQGIFIDSISDLTIGGVSEEVTGISTREGGNIELNIDGNFTANEEISTSVPDRQPGKITISSTGNIDTTQTTLKSNSESTTGGDISLTADGNIQTGDINASTMGNDRGGNITINSGGEVDATAGEIFSASFDGDGGNVTITSENDLKTGYIDSRSEGSGNGGNITLESTGGNVDTSSEELASFSVRGNAGNVSITSNGDIKTADIFSSAGEPLDADGDLTNSSPFETNNTDSNQTQSANGSGGDITLTAEGIIDTSAGVLESFSSLGNGGNISITSKGDLTTGAVFSTAGDPDVGDSANNNTTRTTQTEINSGNSGNISIESTEGAVTITAEIDTVGEAGNAGDITIKAFGDIKTESIESRTGGGEGGDITIESRSGTVDTRVATINTMGTEVEADAGIFSASEKGNAGNITINSQGDVSTGNINSSSLNGRGGNITLESTGGIDTSSGEISSLSQTGDAGNVTLGSNGDLITGNINSTSQNGQGGNITLLSTNGNIDTTGVTVDTMGNEEVAGIFSASEEGNAGNITITSNENLTTGNIDSNSMNGNGGNIALESISGNINTTGGELASLSQTGNAGNVTIASNRDLSTGNIDSRSKGSGQGGNITLESTGGNIDTTGGEIASFSELGDAGDVTITSNGDLSTGNIDSRSNGSGQGGNITLESTGGNIDTTGGEIASLSQTGNDEDVETSNDDTGSELSSFSELGDAGDVTIISSGDLKTANINSRSKGSGQGGNITLESTNGSVDTTVGEIVSRSQTGNAGSVTIKSLSDIQTGNIDSQTQAGQGGDITIESTGGSIETLGTDQDVAGIFAASEEGNAGNVAITSNGNLITGNIDSRSTNSQGGNITLESIGANIDTSAGEVRSSSRRGDAGTVSLTSQGDIKTGSILSFAGRGTDEVEESEDSQNQSGSSNGGDITLKAGGDIDTTAGTNDQSKLESFSREGSGGNISLEAKGDITTGQILSTAGDPQAGNPEDNSNITPLTQTEINERSSGNISIESTEGAVTTTEEINSFATSGNGGSVTIKSRGNLTTGDINSRSDVNGNGGNITLESTDGNIDTTNGDRGISSFSELGNAGDVTITSNGNLTTGDIDSRSDGNGQGGNITLESITRNVNTSQGRLFSFSELGDAGDVTITSNGDLTTGSIDSRSDGNGQGGNITLESITGKVNTTGGELSFFSESGDAGEVNVTITFDNSELSSFSELGTAGDVTITSSGDLTTASINSRSKGNGRGGNITLESTGGNIDTTGGELSSLSESGNGGNVTITSSGDLITGEIFSSSGNPRGSNNNPSILPSENQQQTDNSNTVENSGRRGGNITLIAEGEINTTAGVIESFSRQGEGGDISIEAKGNITTSEIISLAGDPENIPPSRDNTENATITQSQVESETGSPGGDISIQSLEGNVTTQGELISYSNQGNGGNVSIISNGDINIAGIDSRADNRGRGGNILIQSQTGSIDTINGELASSSRTGDGGNIEIIGTGNILVETIFSESEGNGNGGDVTITGNSNIKTANIESFAGGSGTGGNISITTTDGAIDTSVGELVSSSQTGEGGNVILSATGDIITGFIESFSGAGARGGNITLETINGNIDTTVGFLGEEANIPTDADVSSEDVATTFEQERANLSSYAPEGTGGNIVIIQRGQGEITTSNISSFGGESSGAVNITNNDGNINTGVIFSTAINGAGDRISIETLNNGDLNINHIATYSTAEDGTGGEIKLNASGVVNINNVASFGNAGSGDVSIESNSGSINTGTIQTRAPNGTSGNITLNTFSTQGDIRTANVSTEGGEAAGTVEILAPDGSVTTEDLESISESGNAGGIDVQAGEDIETGDQTVDSATGDSNINNEAGGDITTGDQTATTEEGNASINNQATGNITTGDQTAVTNQGNASINNQAGANITTGNQTAITNQGNASINNQATGNITTGNQTALTNQGNANINNQATGNITTGNQTAITNQGNANINNQATGNITTGNQTAITNQGNASINNQATGNITTGNQTAITNQGNASINNQATGNITTQDQIAIGNTTNIINLPGGELNTGEVIQISPPPSIPISNTLPQQLPQIQATPVIPPAANPVQPTTTPVIPPAANPVQPTTTPVIPTNNILPNNPISNPIATNIIQSVQSNSTISTTNNPNLPNKNSDHQQININTDTKTALKNINIINNTPLTVAANSQMLITLEQNRNNEFTDHLGEDPSTQNISIKNIREVLTDIARETGKNSAIIYVTAYQEELQLVLYTSDSDPILKTIPAANRQQLMEVVLQLRVQVTNPSRRKTQSYLPPAQKLYNWLIRPISAELEAANIDTLLFSMDEGLRTLPVAALHDGEQFLVEKYSLSLIPSISLMDINYRPIQDTRVLAMGASEFIEHNSLPAVPVELKTISQQLWKGTQFLNQDFTRNNLLNQRQNYPYPIIHLATHAEFRPGAISNSYIQLWGNQQLQLDEIRELGWNDPPVELLVLSACRTAVGDKNAELGFAGLAVAAGAKSALASVWYVSDEGTLGLMTEFYTQLNNAKIKAEALRQAQLAMLRGEVVITEGQLRGTAARGAVVLPSELGKFENQNLSHPYYWAGFTMVGSPW